MPRHYTEDEKQLVLQRLIANRGDVARTAADCGVTERTIYRWRDEFRPTLTTLTTFPTQNPSASLPPLYTGELRAPQASGGGGSGAELPFNPEVLDTLYDLRDKMMRILDILADSIIPAIEEAPLNQRVAALTQITDRYIKLGHELPADDDDDEIEMEHPVPKVEDLEDEDSTPYSPSQPENDTW